MEPLLAWVFWTLVTIDPSNSILDGLERKSVSGRHVFSVGEVYVDNESKGYELQYSLYQPFVYGPLQPFYGISSTENSGLMFGVGLGYEYDISEKIFLESSFLPGLYVKNEEVYLGEQPFFRAKLGLGYRFTERISASVSYDHRSNARLTGANPGMETLQANVGFNY